MNEWLTFFLLSKYEQAGFLMRPRLKLMMTQSQAAHGNMGLFNYVHLDCIYSMLEFNLNLKSHMNVGNKKTLKKSFIFCILLVHPLCFRRDGTHLSKTLIIYIPE